MKAESVNLLNFLRNASQFIIPLYQRKYAWGQEQCQQLWDDVLNAGKIEHGAGHFFGSVVYISDNALHDSPLLVIDGQQRLTTVTLFLLALSRKLQGGQSYSGLSQEKIRDYYLVNPHEKGHRYNRLLLTESDKETLLALILGTSLPKDPAHRIKENFSWLENRLLRADDSLLQEICCGLTKLLIVQIGLSPKEDNPQLVFESMNSTGLQLTQSDLIRNYILMGLEPHFQECLYKNYWRPMEENFTADFSKFNGFVRHYLTVKTASIPKEAELYKAFRRYYENAKAKDIQAVEAIVQDMREFSDYYCAMVFNQEKSAVLKSVFADIKELDIEVVYPFLMQLYGEWKKGEISEKEFLQCLRLIEAYIFRRAVCGVPTNALGKVFALLVNTIDIKHCVKSLCDAFLAMPPYRRFPNDGEFKQAFVTRDLYNVRICPYWLFRYENDGRVETAERNKYTVEHIMPQTLTEEWKKALGSDWERIHGMTLHSVGNLTLSGYNSSYSNKYFAEKRDAQNGLRYSPLLLNMELGRVKDWNEKEIQERAARLAERAIQIWRGPADVKSSY